MDITIVYDLIEGEPVLYMSHIRDADTMAFKAPAIKKSSYYAGQTSKYLTFLALERVDLIVDIVVL